MQIEYMYMHRMKNGAVCIHVYWNASSSLFEAFTVRKAIDW